MSWPARTPIRAACPRAKGRSPAARSPRSAPRSPASSCRRHDLPQSVNRLDIVLAQRLMSRSDRGLRHRIAPWMGNLKSLRPVRGPNRASHGFLAVDIKLLRGAWLRSSATEVGDSSSHDGPWAPSRSLNAGPRVSVNRVVGKLHNNGSIICSSAEVSSASRLLGIETMPADNQGRDLSGLLLLVCVRWFVIVWMRCRRAGNSRTEQPAASIRLSACAYPTAGPS